MKTTQSMCVESRSGSTALLMLSSDRICRDAACAHFAPCYLIRLRPPRNTLLCPCMPTPLFGAFT